MDHYLNRVERMEGDNQYYCGGSCKSNQDAIRSVRLRNLPKVLNLQFKRTVLNKQTFALKKLNSFVEFPEELDMAQYLSPEAKLRTGTDSEYILTGVVMHVGSDANHGHFVAHIRDVASGRWFKFSDTQVEMLDLGKEKIAANSKSKNNIASKNEYDKAPKSHKHRKHNSTRNTKGELVEMVPVHQLLPDTEINF